MQPNHIRVFLGVNYHTVLGENVHVIGNIPELGNWNAKLSFPLTYHQHGNWSRALTLDRRDQIIEYKYIIVKESTNEIRWEEGSNRTLDTSSLNLKKNELINIESWNQREVNIRMKYNCGAKKILAICGEGVTFGNWKNPIRMVPVSKKDPVTGTRTSYWEHKFFVRHDVKRIKYRFVILDDEEDTITWEREPNRACDFINLTIAPDKRFESHPNKKDCFKFAKKQSRFIKYDSNFVSEFCFDHISDNIIIGPYPQNGIEIKCLAKQDVKAVLNLQTRSDMKHRSIDWEELKRCYRDSKIKVINFSITDMCVEDIRCKAYDAATVLNELVNKYQKVYVHCTAGVWRAPHVVAAFLNFHQGYTIEDAVKQIKQKRSMVYLSKDLLKRAFSKYERKLNSANIYVVNGCLYAEHKVVTNSLTDETISKRKIGQEDKGFQLGGGLREVRCTSARNV